MGIQWNNLLKNVSKTEKFIIFPILSEFLLWAKKFARFAEPPTNVSVDIFGEKQFLKTYIIFHTSLDFDPKNLSRKICFRLVTTAIRVSRGTFFGRSKFFFEKVIIVHLYRSLSTFFVFWQKKSGWQRNDLLIQKKVEEKICRKIVFSNHFRTSSRKVWTIRQKNSCKIVKTTFNVFRGTTSGRFFGMKENCSSLLVLVELIFSTFDVKISANLSKVQPTCPPEHLKVFWREM